MRGIDHFGAEPSASAPVLTTERMMLRHLAPADADQNAGLARLAGGLPAELA